MKTILVAEDGTTVRDILMEVLEAEGYAVHTCVGGEAIPLAVALDPALILVDIDMPGMDGIQVCQELRADARTRLIPLVLMSAAYRLRHRVREVPVDAVLSKPFDLDQLLATVEHLAGAPDAV